MAPCETTDDYYFVLEVSQSADLTSIKSNYRRLAKIRHPDKNPTSPTATVEFQLLHEAYSTLSDPVTRRIYDSRYPSILHTRQNRHDPATHSTPPQQASSANKNSEYEKKLQQLNSRKACKENELLNERRELNKLRGELRILREEVARADKEKAAKDGWWAYMASFVIVRARETEAEKSEWERRHLDRKAAQTIKEKLWEKRDSKVQSLETNLRHINNEIMKVQVAIQREKYEEEQARVREAQMRAAQAAEEWLRQREAEFERAEQERIRRASELRRAWQAREAAAAEKKEKAQKEKAQKEKAQKEKAQKEKAQKEKAQAEFRTRNSQRNSNDSTPFRNTSSFSPASSNCQHRGFWPQIQGAYRCSQCTIITTKFAFECPGCKKMACASCRRVLKGEPPRSTTQQQQHHRTKTSRGRNGGRNSKTTTTGSSGQFEPELDDGFGNSWY